MRILVVDPGKVCGYGLLQWGPHRDVTFTGAELPHDDFVDLIYNPMTGLRTWLLDRVVCEGFDITPRTYQTNPNDSKLWSVKQIGDLETLCRWGNITYERQSRTALAYDKDGSKLKKLGWWAAAVKGEKGHRRDAARHAVKWAVDHRIIDPGVFL